ncbi:MAG: Chromate resistance protein ChrB, partial [Gemmatimonadales bacterium]
MTPSETRWLLLIVQIPRRPDYLRVKIGRRLQRVGAIAIKNSVYALPPTTDAYEDFEWIVREIKEGGGDAFI